jgi:hypothetical protein
MNPDDTNDLRDTETTRPLPLDQLAQPDPPEQPEQPEPEDLDDPRRPSGRHPLSISYLVAGLIFLGVATSWALRETGVVEAGSASWLFPLTLVVVGAIGLAASVVSSARRP